MKTQTKDRLACLVSNLECMMEIVQPEIDWLDYEQETLQEKFDRKSDRWQGSERGDKAQLEIDAFDDLIGSLHEILDNLEIIAGNVKGMLK